METSETLPDETQTRAAAFRAMLSIGEARERAGVCNDRAIHEPTYRLARLCMPACW